MRIGIDARLWSQTGVGRYIRNLVLNLLLIDEKNSYVLFIRKEDEGEIRNQISKIKNPHFAQIPVRLHSADKASRGKQKSKIKLITTSVGWHSLGEQFRFPIIINKENVDVMHFTYQQSVPIFYKSPYIMTVHDLIKHHFITGRSSTNPYWLLGFKMLVYKILINKAARGAKRIIAVSQTTKDEVIDHLMVNKGNVEVVYESADDFNFKKVNMPKFNNYFLFVGNVYPHKNTQNLIEAFKKVVEKKDVKLIFIGSQDYFYNRLKNENSKLISQGKIQIVEGANDNDLAGYYQNAICLIRPSLMEGFSLPPLEALANKCLVLASDIPVHKEIFGESIIYFNPNEIVDIENKMNYVLSLSEKSVNELKINGEKVIRKYSWEKVARQTLEIYENCSPNR